MTRFSKATWATNIFYGQTSDTESFHPLWPVVRKPPDTTTGSITYGAINQTVSFTVNRETTGSASSVWAIDYPMDGTASSVDLVDINATDCGTRWVWPPQDSRRQLLRAQSRRPPPRCHRGGLARAAGVSFANVSPQEITALKLLRGLVSPGEFRRYLKHGFVRVPGASGLTYQVNRSRHTINVWDGIQEVARLCLYLRADYPPTDGVVALMLMVLHDEPAVWRKANVRPFGQGQVMAAQLRAA